MADNLYAILQIARDATPAAVKAAHRKLSKIHNMTTISDTPRSIMNTSSPFARRAIINGKRAERWNANDSSLSVPLRWRKPRIVWLSGDLFHENVPDAWIDRVFAVMALAPQHIFQVLTKRPARGRETMSNPAVADRIWNAAVRLDCEGHLPENNPGYDVLLNGAAFTLPLANVWLGTSVEDQTRADERIPLLLDTPAALRFVSVEPLLGPVRLDSLRDVGFDALYGVADRTIKLDWVIAGGESGPGARPMHPDWARSIRDQCEAAGVPFFFKQWGEWGPARSARAGAPGKYALASLYDPRPPTLIDHYPRQFTGFGSVILERVGKKAAGALLDGKPHGGMPGRGAGGPGA